MTSDLKSRFKQIITSGPLAGLEMFNINETYIEVESKNLWLIDGGIQLRFPVGIIQLGWSEEHELIIASENDIKSYQGELVYKELHKGNIHHLHNLSGKRVIDHKWRWYAFEAWNNESSEFESRDTLLELVLTFHTGEILQIAAVDYQLDPHDDPIEITFNIATEILVSFQKKIEIQT